MQKSLCRRPIVTGERSDEKQDDDDDGLKTKRETTKESRTRQRRRVRLLSADEEAAVVVVGEVGGSFGALGGQVLDGRFFEAAVSVGRVEGAGVVPEGVGVVGHEALELGEGLVDGVVGEGVDEGARADAFRERRAEDAVAVDGDFARGELVGVGGDAGDGAGQVEFGVELEDAVGVGVGDQAEDVGDHGGHDAVDGDGLAVAQLELLRGFEGAREGVAEVHGPQERFLPEVRPDALEHGVDGALDHDVGDGFLPGVEVGVD
mmetsp:Transcript_29779/g.91171  ORF Transcript_29779/g.91171 Transcript_29779/m.91171 type:complete len:262 (-) Transcript_29779:606-1391(-)